MSPDFMSLWDYDRPEIAAQRFDELLPQAREGGDPGYLAELLTQIARTHGLRSQFDRAHELLDEAAALLTDDMPRARLRYLLERGRAHNSSGAADQARPLFLEAWELGQASSEDGLAIDAAHMMAIVEPLEKQTEWNLKALELTERTDDQKAKKWLGSLYNNVGWTYFSQEDYDAAMGMFVKALAARESQKQIPETRVAHWCIARAHRARGEVKKALAMQKALLEELEAAGEEQDGYVFEELAECYLALGRPEARHFFGMAHGLLSKDQWLVDNEAERLNRLNERAVRAVST